MSGWLSEFSGTYGAIRLWLVAVFGPGLAVSELVQGHVALGTGFALICLMVWAQLARRLGATSEAWDRIANACLAVGGALLLWHYARWWWEYLK